MTAQRGGSTIDGGCRVAAKQDPTWIAAIGAIAALVTAALTALVTGWLGGREKVTEDLRATRLRVYPSVSGPP